MYNSHTTQYRSIVRSGTMIATPAMSRFSKPIPIISPEAPRSKLLKLHVPVVELEKNAWAAMISAEVDLEPTMMFDSVRPVIKFDLKK